MITAAVLAVVAAVAAIESNDEEASPHQVAGQPSGPPEHSGPPERKPMKPQSPATWVDTKVKPKDARFSGWVISDGLKRAWAWDEVIAEHLSPAGPFVNQSWRLRSQPGHEAAVFYDLLVHEGDEHVLKQGCLLIEEITSPSHNHSATGSGCRADRVAGPQGEDAWIIAPRSDAPAGVSRVGRGRIALVLVERADGTLGYVMAANDSGVGPNRFPLELMVEAAADARLSLPAKAFRVPNASVITSVVRDHFGSFRPEDSSSRLGRGSVHTWGNAIPHTVQVVSAGRAPQCGGRGLGSCVARQVYGAADPTTVYVGRWCLSRNTCWMELAYVGPRNTALVEVGLPFKRLNSAKWRRHMEKRLIDLLLDPRLQTGHRR